LRAGCSTGAWSCSAGWPPDLQGPPVAPLPRVNGHQPIKRLLLAAKALEAQLRARRPVSHRLQTAQVCFTEQRETCQAGAHRDSVFHQQRQRPCSRTGPRDLRSRLQSATLRCLRGLAERATARHISSRPLQGHKALTWPGKDPPARRGSARLPRWPGMPAARSLRPKHAWPPQRAASAPASVCGAPLQDTELIWDWGPGLAEGGLSARLLVSQIRLRQRRWCDCEQVTTHRCTREAEVREQLVLVEHWRSQRTV
jgi:hypothetical protein